VVIFGCSGFERPEGWVGGEGPLNATCMIVGEAPGPDEWQAFPKRPFVGKAGKLLFETLPLNRCLLYVTNVVKEFPPNDGRAKDKGMTPTAPQIALWSLYLDAELQRIGPSLILALGGVALGELTGWNGTMEDARGEWLDFKRPSGAGVRARVLGTYHPSYIGGRGREFAPIWKQDLAKFAAACRARGC
jgi:uracil-DNA glycosylase